MAMEPALFRNDHPIDLYRFAFLAFGLSPKIVFGHILMISGFYANMKQQLGRKSADE
ncbi:hypothetical protein [Paenibacillus sp. Soil522]|uniref:hypothetical protein n=1 Tax=Paenibacillus sp. Soil522 TaxID=1736388 RepID=UPI000ACE38E7|nr:hypothetical protein [Paenibacillus sp. Soil522]